jgi:hypothetical protein
MTHQCYKCQGIGLIKTDFQVCQNCCGKKCIKCSERGYMQFYFSECYRCLGDGINGYNSDLWDKYYPEKDKN